MTKTIALSVLVALTMFPYMLRYVLKKRYQKLSRSLEEQEDNSYYECIFFDYKNFYCKPHLINKEDCGEICSYIQLERILHYIGSAKRSICICVYMITLKQISTELVKASRRGVEVRVITDKLMSKTTVAQSNLHYWTKNGVTSKTNATNNEMMHHKYCLIDEKDSQAAKALFGSANLTAQAFCKNFEVMILTNNSFIIKKLSEEFEELWALL